VFFSDTAKETRMGTGKDDKHSLPETWSDDHSAGGTPKSKRPCKENDTSARTDEGIRPQDLTTENDQGAV
jgi:hypothetical protein